jgi:hypothetical protein
MILTLKSLNRHSHPRGGETLVVEIGDTELTVEYTADHKDIRVCDGSTVVKIRLNQDCSVRDILRDDRFLTAGESPALPSTGTDASVRVPRDVVSGALSQLQQRADRLQGIDDDPDLVDDREATEDLINALGQLVDEEATR